MRKGWLPTALAVFAMAGAARADAATVNPLESVIEIVGDAARLEPAVVTSLPPMTIEGDLPRRHAVANDTRDHGALASFVIDPDTGLAVPRILRDRRESVASRGPAMSSGLHLDPATGLMVPDYIRTTRVNTSAARRYIVDRRTGLMVPNFHRNGPSPPATTENHMVIDPSTGLMIPAAFVSRRNHPRGP